MGYSLHRPLVSLLVQFALREIRNRYLGSLSGAVWALAQPLALLGIYTFVFSVIFKVRFPELVEFGFISFVAVALWPWLAFQEAVQRASMSVQENAELIKKIAIPNEILVLAAVTASFAIHGLGFMAVLLVLWLIGKPVVLLFLPAAALLWLWLAGFALGLGLILAALQVFLRDVGHVMTPLLMIWFYATPILYPLSLVPESVQTIVQLNPMTFFAELFRSLLLQGQWRPGLSDITALIATAVLLGLGRGFFRRCSTRFEEFV